MSHDPATTDRLSISFVTGLSRGAYSPYLGALVLWLNGPDIGGALEKGRLVQAAGELLEGHVGRVYVEKFTERGLTMLAGEVLVAAFLERDLASNDVDTNSKKQSSPLIRNLIEDLVIETEAILRRLALKELDIHPSTVTDAFRSHSKYNEATKGLEALEKEIRSLGQSRTLAECPSCKLVGSVSPWFGYRTIGGKRVSQSWCRVCRSTGPSTHAESEYRSLFSSESWFALAKWGKQTGELSPWERSFAYNMGEAMARGWSLSIKQERASKTLATKAIEKGFRP